MLFFYQLNYQYQIQKKMSIEHIKNMEYPAIRKMMADLTKLDIPTRAKLIKRLTQLEVVYSIDYIQTLLDKNVDVYNLAKKEIDEYVGIHQYNRTISHFIIRQNLDAWDEKRYRTIFKSTNQRDDIKI